MVHRYTRLTCPSEKVSESALPYLPISEQGSESAEIPACPKLPEGHPLSTREAMHRQTSATAQTKPVKTKQHTTQGLYLAIGL